MNGVSNYYSFSHQFISVDGTRSAFDSYRKHKFTDSIIPQGKQIRTVETLLKKEKGWLCGFKWIGDDGAVLVAVDYIDDDDWTDSPKFVVTTLTLKHNQRLVGIKSASFES